MLETKDDTTLPSSQIETDSLLAWRLQAEEYKRVYRLPTPSSLLPAQKSTFSSYQFQNPQSEVISFALILTQGDGDCFFHAVNKPILKRDALVKKLLDNPTEAVRHAFAYEIRQFLYLGLSVSHPGQENEACQRLLTSDIRERFLNLQKTEEALRIKVDKIRLALGEKETHGKRPLELLALLGEKSSVLTVEFEQVHQAVLQTDSAIYQYCCQEDVFKSYVQFYLKEARGYIPFSRDFGRSIPITTIDVINQLFELKIQVYLPLKSGSRGLQLANQLQRGEVIPIFHNGVNHFSGLEKQKVLLKPITQFPKNHQSDLEQHAEERMVQNINKKAVSPPKSNREKQNNPFVSVNQDDVNKPDKDGRTPVYVAAQEGCAAVTSIPQTPMFVPASQLAVNMSSEPAMLSQFQKFTKPQLSTGDLMAFLKFVAKGEQKKAEVMLKSNPALALMSGNVTDLSKRTFEGITAFQYAVWALDWHMWTMIRRYLPDDAAKEQVQGFETGSWVKSHGVHAQYLLDNLVEALQTAFDLYNVKKYFECNTAWVQQVGSVQCLLPAHVINEYCHPARPFYPCPNFKDAAVLPRIRTINAGEWFTAICNGGQLGDKFAVIRSGYAGAAFAVAVREWMVPVVTQKCMFMPGELCIDRNSVRALSSTRTAQRAELVAELRSKPVQSMIA